MEDPTKPVLIIERICFGEGCGTGPSASSGGSTVGTRPSANTSGFVHAVRPNASEKELSKGIGRIARAERRAQRQALRQEGREDRRAERAARRAVRESRREQRQDVDERHLVAEKLSDTPPQLANAYSPQARGFGPVLSLSDSLINDGLASAEESPEDILWAIHNSQMQADIDETTWRLISAYRRKALEIGRPDIEDTLAWAYAKEARGIHGMGFTTPATGDPAVELKHAEHYLLAYQGSITWGGRSRYAVMMIPAWHLFKQYENTARSIWG
jgi:hypothetical protein